MFVHHYFFGKFLLFFTSSLVASPVMFGPPPPPSPSPPPSSVRPSDLIFHCQLLHYRSLPARSGRPGRPAGWCPLPTFFEACPDGRAETAFDSCPPPSRDSEGLQRRLQQLKKRLSLVLPIANDCQKVLGFNTRGRYHFCHRSIHLELRYIKAVYTQD